MGKESLGVWSSSWQEVPIYLGSNCWYHKIFMVA